MFLPCAFLFILPVALLVFLFFLFVKSGRTGRWIISIVLGLMLLVPAALIVAIALPHVSRARLHYAGGREPGLIENLEVVPDFALAPTAPQPPRTPAIPQPPLAPTKPRPPLPPAIPQLPRAGATTQQSSSDSYPSDSTDLPFEPDVYASKESAVRAVARLAAQQYKALITSPEQVPRSLQATCSGSLVGGESINASSRFGAIAGQEVRMTLGWDLALEFGGNAPPPEPPRSGHVTLHLSLVREPRSTPEMEETGLVQGTMVGLVGQVKRYAEYVSKPWREDFHRWRSLHDPTSWVLGESEDFCGSRQESVDQATRAAVPGIRVPVLRELSESASQRRNWLNRQADLYRWLDDEALRRLKAGDFQTDVFTQEFKRPYGSVWRSAVLVHVPPEKAKSLLDAYGSQAEAQRASWLRTLVSGAGMLVLIVVVYLFLNAATRGYYVWSVRAATAVLAVFGVWCIVMFVS